MTSHTVTHCPHGLPLPGPCSLCADGLRAPGTDDHVHQWEYCQTCDNGDLVCGEWTCREHIDTGEPESSRVPAAWLGALLLLLALLLGAGIGWWVRG